MTSHRTTSWVHPWQDRNPRLFPALAHIAITVTELDRSIDWYGRLFGEPPVVVGRHDTFRWASWPTFGLHQHDAPVAGEFDARRVGLDHVAFACATRDELIGWQETCQALGIETAEIFDAHYGAGLAVWDPDGIALEFFAPPPHRTG